MDQNTDVGIATEAISFTIGDIETTASLLAVIATSDNQALVTDSNIVISGTGANRSIVITPEANQSGTATISVAVSDGVNQTTGSFSLAVNAVNDPPIATDDTVSTAEGASITFDLLANDSDLENDSLTVSAIGTPAYGTVTDNLDGTITYTANVDAAGSGNVIDSISYAVSDGQGGTATASIDIIIVPANTLVSYQ